MKINKKIISIFIAASLTIGLTACGNSKDISSDTGQTTSVTEKYYIGICQFAEHQALNEATNGFKAALTEKLGEDNIEFDEQNAHGSKEECQTIYNKFATENADIIMANATGALQEAVANINNIPIVATSVTDYNAALDNKDISTIENIIGTSDLAPIEEQEDLMLEVIPNINKLGIIYSSNEVNSAYQVKKMKKALKEDNIEFKEYIIDSSDNIEEIFNNACMECDVLYVPTDNMLAANVEAVKNVVLSAGTPLFAGEEGLCEAGIATLSINYYELGYTTGEMAYEILKNGKSPKDLSIKYPAGTTKKYNKEICEALNINIPNEYTEIDFNK